MQLSLTKQQAAGLSNASSPTKQLESGLYDRLMKIEVLEREQLTKNLSFCNDDAIFTSKKRCTANHK